MTWVTCFHFPSSPNRSIFRLNPLYFLMLWLPSYVYFFGPFFPPLISRLEIDDKTLFRAVMRLAEKLAFGGGLICKLKWRSGSNSSFPHAQFWEHETLYFLLRIITLSSFFVSRRAWLTGDIKTSLLPSTIISCFFGFSNIIFFSLIWNKKRFYNIRKNESRSRKIRVWGRSRG